MSLSIADQAIAMPSYLTDNEGAVYLAIARINYPIAFDVSSLVPIMHTFVTGEVVQFTYRTYITIESYVDRLDE